jgi:CarD family transcriptional regulator
MYLVGDKVVHPMHGAGVIDDIVQERLDGKTKEYYVFKMPVGGLILKIPVSNSEAIGIRGIISPIEAEALFDAIPELSIDANTNWNKRYQENMLRLKSGDLYEVARVIKALMHRDHCRGLSTGERKMLHNARQIMLSEIVLPQECEYHEVELRLDKAMMQIPVV